MSQQVTRARLDREKAMADVLKMITPQMGSGPEILTSGEEGPAPDSGAIDYWMMTNMPADILMPLVGLQTIANTYDRQDIKNLVVLTLRGLKGINGYATKQLETVSLGLGGAMGRKVVKRPGLIGRNLTNRRWREKAEAENAEIDEG